MSERLTVYGYLSGEESLRRTELVWGRVREPAAPRYGHQSVVTRMTVLLDQHAREAGVGRVCVSPIDVVLDEPRALVVQPDVVFVSHRRASIIREQIWGALTRGASPLGLPDTLSRAPRRRRASTFAEATVDGPFAWLARALARGAGQLVFEIASTG